MQILKSKYILPITSEPLRNAGLMIDKEIIKDIGSYEDLKMKYPAAHVKDFGDSIIMPGFVNVHSHAEYSVMRGLITGKNFFDWLNNLINYDKFLKKKNLKFQPNSVF